MAWEYKHKKSFLQNHGDTLAVMGVNIAIAAIMLNITLSNNSQIAAMNSRLDATNQRIDTTISMFYDLLKEVRQHG